MMPGVLLGERYRIVSEIGQGGFGKTYLCEDGNRFNERCILKEFAPQVQGTEMLVKAQELFEREAGVMYRLQHPQIPQFREMFRVNNSSGKGQLFLVQDYVDGDNYQRLLRLRMERGERFSELEAKTLMIQVLPVLQYLHSLGVIHRDISPDNLICRRTDGVPVLIDFGGVKEISANAAHRQSVSGDTRSISGTRLGKVGYAPTEQMHQGKVYPHSDVYALAATAIALMTGLEPVDLIDAQHFTWNWRSHLQISPEFGKILDRILDPRPQNRFQSAEAALNAIVSIGTVAPAQPEVPTQLPLNSPSKPTKPIPNLLGKAMLLIGGIIGASLLGWFAASHWSKSRPRQRIHANQPAVILISNSTPTDPMVASQMLDRSSFDA
jgi:serine/threonine protein kinase, bacterial